VTVEDPERAEVRLASSTAAIFRVATAGDPGRCAASRSRRAMSGRVFR
jgi:hypothetical protein